LPAILRPLLSSNASEIIPTEEQRQQPPTLATVGASRASVSAGQRWRASPREPVSVACLSIASVLTHERKRSVVNPQHVVPAMLQRGALKTASRSDRGCCLRSVHRGHDLKRRREWCEFAACLWCSWGLAPLFSSPVADGVLALVERTVARPDGRTHAHMSQQANGLACAVLAAAHSFAADLLATALVGNSAVWAGRLSAFETPHRRRKPPC
jgi:hypothetical protein